METKTDLNNAGTVDQQDLNNADLVNQQDLNNDAGSVDQQKQDEKLADGTDANKDVKYSDLKKATERATTAEEARKVAEEQAAYAQRQLELAEQQRLINANPQQVKSEAEQALEDLGLTSEDLYGENQLKFIERKDQITNSRLQQQQGIRLVQQFVSSHPDINQIVGSVNPATGQIVSPNAEVLALVTKKPYLAGATLEMIYDAVVQERRIAEFEKSQAALKEHRARTGVDNDTLPLGGSAAGGGAAGDVQQNLMTREQTAEIERKLANGEIV